MVLGSLATIDCGTLILGLSFSTYTARDTNPFLLRVRQGYLGWYPQEISVSGAHFLMEQGGDICRIGLAVGVGTCLGFLRHFCHPLVDRSS